MEINGTNTPNNIVGNFGAVLKKAREKKKLSIDEVAKELFILKRYLQALENEDFQALPQATFARGFAINYAKFLELDPHQIGNSFDMVYPDYLKVKDTQDIDSPLRPISTLHRDGRIRFRFNPFLLLAIIAVLSFAVFLMRTVVNADKDSQTPTVVDTETIDLVSPTDKLQGASLTGVAIPESVSNSNDTATFNSVGVGATGSAINLSNDTGAGAVLANLDLQVRKDTRITVSDARGVPLMAGVQPKGNYKLSGKPPFRVEIADVGSVTLQMNQQSVNLKQYANNNQADFTLNP